MYKNTVTIGYRFTLLILITLLPPGQLFAQHRGDNLSFQGLEDKGENGIKALAMGGAYTSMSGDITSIFYNSAGLADIDKLEINLSANNFSREMWENQDYRPNRLYVTLPFYLEGLYTPDPANDWIQDSDLALDSSYVVAHPTLGNEPTSREAADWTHKDNGFIFNNIAVAFPFRLLDRKFVVAGSYHRQNTILDFDRNDTYLDPHIGTYIYDGMVPQQVGGDTLNVNWYRFLRSRKGETQNIKASLAYDFNKNLKLGITANLSSGSSDDLQSLNKVGYFGLIDENDFFFVHDTLNTTIRGTSDYSSTSFEIGVIYKFDNLSLGLNIKTPYTITRDWDYTSSVEDTNGTVTRNLTGQDRIDVPVTYTMGFHFKPVKRFIFSMDYEYAPYSKAKFKLTQTDSIHAGWTDRTSVKFGVQYIATDFLTVMAGYKNIPEVFVPDGAAFRDQGPKTNSWSLGASVKILNFGTINAAWIMSQLKYYDSYYSNTNYVTEKRQNFAIGYTFKF